MKKSSLIFEKKMVQSARIDALRKLSPQQQLRNPVMFVVYLGSLFTTALWLHALSGPGEAPA
ncbi:MAG: hypothetical protein REI12_13520, partial [Pedobacter sp.]|nr:hypothetical protein [Pedobacter sp.]